MFLCCMGSTERAGRVSKTRPALILTMLFEIVSRHNCRIVSVMGGDLFAFELLDQEAHSHFAAEFRFLFQEADDSPVFERLDEGLWDIIPAKESDIPPLRRSRSKAALQLR